MARLSDRLAVQSYCFRGFTEHAVVAQKVRDCGLTAVEACGVHVKFDQRQTYDSVLKTYRDAGVSISSLGVNGVGRGGDERAVFDFARAAGVKLILVDFPIDNAVEALRLGEKLADEYDVRLGIHNHGGAHWLGNWAALNWMLKQASPRVGVALDLAWAMHAHEDPLKMVERIGPRLYGLHLKDFVFDRAGRHQDAVVGTGNLDLPKLAAALANVGFAGQPTLEYEGDVNNPVPALVECVKMIKAAM